MKSERVNDDGIAKLAQLAAVLIPASATMPAAAALADLDALVRTAIGACGWSDVQLGATIDALPGSIDWDGAKGLAARDPASFRIASTLASAAYYMAPEVLRRLGFPADRRQPAGVEDFLEEFETGILDAVTDRGPRFRDPQETTA